MPRSHSGARGLFRCPGDLLMPGGSSGARVLSWCLKGSLGASRGLRSQDQFAGLFLAVDHARARRLQAKEFTNRIGWCRRREASPTPPPPRKAPAPPRPCAQSRVEAIPRSMVRLLSLSAVAVLSAATACAAAQADAQSCAAQVDNLFSKTPVVWSWKGKALAASLDCRWPFFNREQVWVRLRDCRSDDTRKARVHVLAVHVRTALRARDV